VISKPSKIVLVLVLLAAASAAPAGTWSSWRGPHDDGSADATGLVASWSPAGENLRWKADFVGRSTPVVQDGQACVLGRVGEGIDRQERVACFDAETGELRWEHRFNVYHTTVPFNRVGWASLVGDPETGNLYAHGVGGQLYAYDRDGRILWSYHLAERLGHASGYGGRTQTPLVYGDLLILSHVSAGWGDQAPPRHRYFAYDKRNGDLIWAATPGGFPKDMNTQSGQVVAEIGGRTLLIGGNADGSVYAMDIRDGSKVWEFQLSKRGLNSNVLVEGDVVYASHSEENVDAPTMGRVVAFKGTGTGDITKTAEVWRSDVSSGFPSPAFGDGRLYVVDNSANLYALDAGTGTTLWKHSLGTVGKGSPVLADGKIYVTEVNGRFHILRPGKDGVEVLDSDEIQVEDGRYAEIYGSPAIAYGRVYLATEAGLYCIGAKGGRAKPDKPAKPPKPARSRDQDGLATIAPADVVLDPGGSQSFRIVRVDSGGRLSPGKAEDFALKGLDGKLDADGRFTASDKAPQAGAVVATVGGRESAARVRVMPALPYEEGFESLPEGKPPVGWIGAGGKFVGGEREGRKVLVQPVRERGLQRSETLFGSSDWKNATIEVDVKGSQAGRRRPDIGVVVNGYILDLQGSHQQVEIRSWTSALRMAKQADFAWEMDTWYRVKLAVDASGDHAIVRGKVWKTADPEPEDWTIVAEDPFPIRGGCAGLVGYAPAEIYYDNLKVTVD